MFSPPPPMRTARRGCPISSRFLVVYALTASLNSHQAWLHLSSRLRSISETGLRKALLEGGTAEHATGDPRPLLVLLWSPLSWEADRLTTNYQIVTGSLPIRSPLSWEADTLKHGLPTH